MLVGSLSKTVAPGLRFGFIATPGSWLGRIDPEAQATGWALSPLCLRLASEWIEDGTALRRLAWQRRQIERRWKMARKLLGPRVAGPASPHLWLTATDGEVGLAGIAHAASIECAAAQVFAVGPDAPDALRLSLSAAPGLVPLQQALQALAEGLGVRRATDEVSAALSLSSMSRQDVSND